MRTAIVIVALALLAVVPSRLHAAVCRSTCTEEMRACRQACEGAHGRDLRQCRTRCGERSTCNAPGVRARTFAWVETVCTEEDGKATLSQKLVVRQGNCDPLTLLELPGGGPVPDPLLALGGVCPIYGSYRLGWGSVTTGLLQRLAVLPDASGIVFELTDDHSLFPSLTPPPPIEEGYYFVRADGTGLRWLGPPSHNQIIVIAGAGFQQADATFATISPNSELLATTGMGPGPDGEPSIQVFLIRIRTGERRQLTHLPPASQPSSLNFADDRSIFYFDHATQSPFEVGVDGGGPVSPPVLQDLPGGHLVQRFAIAGNGAVFLNLFLLDRTAKRTYPGYDHPAEIFRVDRQRVLQLTNFGYPDVLNVVPAHGGAQFSTSADPLGENPDGVCQLFWVDEFSGRLRQLTHFPYDGRPRSGCLPAPGVSCTINGDVWDRRANVTAMVSSCDPFGRNADGEQGFTMRPDGTRLRQVTSFRGRETLPGGGVRVELGGPTGYSARIF